MIAASPFKDGRIDDDPIGYEVWLEKRDSHGPGN
jgi:hypothetical protein